MGQEQGAHDVGATMRPKGAVVKMHDFSASKNRW